MDFGSFCSEALLRAVQVFRDRPGELLRLVAGVLLARANGASVSVAEAARVAGVDPGHASVLFDALEAGGALRPRQFEPDPLEVGFAADPVLVLCLAAFLMRALPVADALAREFASRGTRVQLLAVLPPDLESGDLRNKFRPLLPALRAVLLSAAHEVVMLSPFLDRDGIGFLLDDLRSAARRGVRIVVITRDLRRGSPQSGALALLYRGLAQASLQECLETYEFLPGPAGRSFHAKLVVVDGGSAAYLGSANLTQSGLDCQFELGCLLSGEGAGHLHALVRQLFRSRTVAPVSAEAVASRESGGEDA